MNLKHIKMANGEDVIAHLEILNYKDTFIYRCHAPVQIYIDPEFGYIAKNWIFLSKNTFADILPKDIIFVNSVSDQAESYYQEYINRSSKPVEEEDLLESLIQSKLSTKH